LLTLFAGQAESLWDEALPVDVRELPEDLAALDGLLSDPGLLAPIVARLRREVVAGAGGVVGWAADDRDGDLRAVDGAQAALPLGYRTLVAEVSDSIYLRRFCRISLSERVPDESTIRKLTRRFGAETVSELTRALIEKATARRSSSTTTTSTSATATGARRSSRPAPTRRSRRGSISTATSGPSGRPSWPGWRLRRSITAFARLRTPTRWRRSATASARATCSGSFAAGRPGCRRR
jgi:transposase, IS5 family